MRKLLSRLARSIYLVPFVGMKVRQIVESRPGQRYYQDPAYWNASLTGWASSYLGGTFANDLRDLATLFMVERRAPAATSFLDLGCAGATMASKLGAKFSAYHGIDISEVAIAKARENVARTSRPGLSCALEVSTLEAFQPPRRFDVIVFNEVLYYVPLRDLPGVLRKYTQCLEPEGLFVISMKNTEVARLVQQILLRELQFEQGLLYQQQPTTPGWKTTHNAETPAYLIQTFRAKR